MAPERRNQVVLFVAMIALVAATYRAWPRPSVVATPASNARATGETSTTGQMPAAPPQAPAVHLPELDADRPKPVTTMRNLFRFKPKPPPAPAVTEAPRVTAAAPQGPQGPPPPPPITLKLIGLVNHEGATGPKIAVLRDAAGGVLQGTEGNIIDGRYRILHIGAESVEIAYVDGTGRKTIRLAGS
jgi:hypothetical protein